MRRVAIIGNAGGGKTTLAKRVAADLGVPYRCVDAIQWLPNWRFNPEYEAVHREILTEPAWVLDGVGTWASIEERFAVADTILWVDLPLRTHLWWATKRLGKNLVGSDPDVPTGCSLLKNAVGFYRMILDIERQHRGRLALAVESARDRGKVVHVLRTPDQIARFRAGAWKFAEAA